MLLIFSVQRFNRQQTLVPFDPHSVVESLGSRHRSPSLARGHTIHQDFPLGQNAWDTSARWNRLMGIFFGDVDGNGLIMVNMLVDVNG